MNTDSWLGTEENGFDSNFVLSFIIRINSFLKELLPILFLVYIGVGMVNQFNIFFSKPTDNRVLASETSYRDNINDKIEKLDGRVANLTKGQGDIKESAAYMKAQLDFLVNVYKKK